MLDYLAKVRKESEIQAIFFYLRVAHFPVCCMRITLPNQGQKNTTFTEFKMTDKKTDTKDRWEDDVWGQDSLMKRSHINQDTYLNCWCPHCEKALNEGEKAVFQIVNNQGEVGISKVTPSLNVLDREATIHVEDDEELADVRCPHCEVSLIEPDQLCIQDGCKMMKFNVSVSNSIKLQLIVCIRRTCRWYVMSDEDNERLILRDSHEW